MKIYLTFAAVVFSLSLSGGSNAATLGNCVPTATKYIAETSSRSISEAAFKTIPGTAVNFVQKTAGCVIVTFTIRLGGDTGTLQIKPILTGQPAAIVFPSSPASYEFPETRTLTAQFIFHNVAAGDQSVRMQWWTDSMIDTTDTLVAVQYIK